MKNLLLTFVLLSPAAQAMETISGCQEGDYVFVNQATASVEISGRGYSPNCLKVKAGTTVSIQASGRHPLQGMRAIAGVENPFQSANGSESQETHTLNKPGQYGYFCTAHGDESGRGMAGAILVIP